MLEIIGNSKNVPRLQKHFKKMFAGIHTVILDEEQTQVLGLASKEGEEVSGTDSSPGNCLQGGRGGERNRLKSWGLPPRRERR